MSLLIEKQLPLNILFVSNYLLYAENNNIASEGLRLVPNCNLSQLKSLDLSNNRFM